MKNRKLLFVLFVSLISYIAGYGQTIYKHDFGTQTADFITSPYVGVAPMPTIEPNLTTTGWTNSANVAFSGTFGGFAGRAITLANSSGTPTITLSLTITAGYQLSVTQFNFWRGRVAAGAQNMSMTIGGISVYNSTTAPLTPVPNPAATLGVTNVANAVTNLTGTVAVVITLSGATGAGRFSLDDFELIGNVTRQTKTTISSGDWSNPAVWSPVGVPAGPEFVVINHAITSSAAITRSSGSTTTINSGGSLSTTSMGTYTDAGVTTVDVGGSLIVGSTFTNNSTLLLPSTINGTFQLNAGGSVTGTSLTYGISSTLNFNNTGVFTVGSDTDPSWATASSPFNVNVLQGGLTISTGSGSRTVIGTFATAAAVTLSTTILNITGTCQINAGGSFASGAPTYGGASTLVYNQGGAGSVTNEWTGNTVPPIAGLGRPHHVTIQNTTTLTTPATSRGMGGNLNITSGNFILGADFFIGGNWNRVSTAAFTPGSMKVIFARVLPTTHTVTVSSSGTETFSFLEIQQTGTLRLATNTNVNVTAVSGLLLNSTNATATVDLNGQILTVSGGGNLAWGSGVKRITSAVANGTFVVSTNALTISSGGLGLTTDANTILRLQQQFNLNNFSLTISGTAQMDLGGNFNTNSPIYTNTSTLSYTSGVTYGRGFEWSALGVGTMGTTPGYPNNVQISNTTNLNYNNGTPLAKAIFGNLTIASGSTFDMANGTPTGPGDLTIGGTVTNNGIFTFANVASSVVVVGDFTTNGTVTLGSVSGADLKLASNLINTATFNGNNRAVWFAKAGTQTVSSSTPLTIPFLLTAGTGTTVQLLSDVVISSSPTGTNVISFGSPSDVIDINGRNLTIGATGNTGVISGTGTFKGSTTSNLTLLGTGISLGALSFTSGFQNLGTFTMNRQAAAIGCVMGSPLAVTTSLVLTAGLVDLSSFDLTLAAAATIGGTPSANNFVIADDSLGRLLKTFSAAGSFVYPIGDNFGTIEYTPATLTFSGGSYAGTVGVRVIDAAHPDNGGAAQYLTRYWQVSASGVTPASYTFAGTYVAVDIFGTESLSLPGCWNGTSWTDVGATGIGSSTCTVTGTAFPYATNDFSAKTGSLFYRSRQTGDWNVATTWETSTNNVTWIAAVSSPTSSAETITILTGHTVTITAAVNIDQVFVTGNLIVSGAAIAVTINNGAGTDLTINNGGVVTMLVTGASGGWSAAGTGISILSGGTYIHNSARAISPFLDRTVMDTNSTFIYRGSSTLNPAVSLSSRTFGHLRFESTSGSLIISPNFTTTICTSNDFSIGSNVTLNATSLITTSQFVVSGNFTNNGTMDNFAGFFNFNFSGATKTISGTSVPSFDTVNVTGSYTLNTNVNFIYTLTTSILTVAAGAVLDNGGVFQIIGSIPPASVVINGKFITRDAEGFTGPNAAIPTMATTVGTASTVEYGGANQTVTPFTTYNNVIVSGTGTKTLLTSPIIMNGDLNVNASILLVNTNQVIEVKKAVTVAASGATFEIKNNGQLVQVDDIVNAANVYSGGNTGNIIYNRIAAGIRGFDYVYWASPVIGQSLDAIYSSPSPGFKYLWNPTVSNINTPTTLTSGNWQAASGIMTPTRGYIVRGSSFYGMAATPIPAIFTGVPSNGQISTSISRGGNTTASQVGVNSATVTNLDDNWNLIGNPYASAIDALSFLSDSNNAATINGFVWLWRHLLAPTPLPNPFYGSFASNYSNDYIAYNSIGSNPPGFNGKIAAGQAFFVAMVDGAAATQSVIFKNTMRKDNLTNAIMNNTQFYRNSSITDTDLAVEKHRIWMDLVDDNNNSVSTLVGYAPEATTGLDRMYDAFKNVANEKSIYSIAENETLIIQGRPWPFDENDQVAIGVNTPIAGDYKIAIAAVDGFFLEGQDLFLEDLALHVIHDLRQAPYSFTTAAGIFNDRFVLRYTNTTLGNPDFGNIDNSVIVATNHGELTVESSIENMQEVTVYDILGRQLFFSKGINNNSFITSAIITSQQTLIVKIKLENGTIVTKKIIL